MQNTHFNKVNAYKIVGFLINGFLIIVCPPQLYIDFKKSKTPTYGNDVRDVVQNLYITSHDVTLEEKTNSGQFPIDGWAYINFYEGRWLGDKLTVSFRFYEYPGGDDEQVLISNCEPMKRGSVEIVMVPNNKEIIFRLDTKGIDGEVRVPYEVCYLLLLCISRLCHIGHGFLKFSLILLNLESKIQKN